MPASAHGPRHLPVGREGIEPPTNGLKAAPDSTLGDAESRLTLASARSFRCCPFRGLPARVAGSRPVLHQDSHHRTDVACGLWNPPNSASVGKEPGRWGIAVPEPGKELRRAEEQGMPRITRWAGGPPLHPWRGGFAPLRGAQPGRGRGAMRRRGPKLRPAAVNRPAGLRARRRGSDG